MPDNFFTRQSFGGVPNYVWLGAGGVAVIFIVRRQGQQKAQPGLTQAQQQQLAMQQQEAALQAQMAQGQMPTYGSSGAPIYVLPQTSPGVSAPGAPPATTPAATAQQVALTGVTGYTGPVGVFQQPAAIAGGTEAPLVGNVPQGTILTETGPPVSGQSYTWSSGAPGYEPVTSSMYVPVSYPLAGGQTGTGYVWEPNVSAV